MVKHYSVAIFHVKKLISFIVKYQIGLYIFLLWIKLVFFGYIRVSRENQNSWKTTLFWVQSRHILVFGWVGKVCGVITYWIHSFTNSFCCCCPCEILLVMKFVYFGIAAWKMWRKVQGNNFYSLKIENSLKTLFRLR